jgi:hypothetical protein
MSFTSHTSSLWDKDLVVEVEVSQLLAGSCLADGTARSEQLLSLLEKAVQALRTYIPRDQTMERGEIGLHAPRVEPPGSHRCAFSVVPLQHDQSLISQMHVRALLKLDYYTTDFGFLG